MSLQLSLFEILPYCEADRARGWMAWKCCCPGDGWTGFMSLAYVKPLMICSDCNGWRFPSNSVLEEPGGTGLRETKRPGDVSEVHLLPECESEYDILNLFDV